MRYACELIIDLPRERIIELFDTQENLKQWQPGLMRLMSLFMSGAFRKQTLADMNRFKAFAEGAAA